MGHDAAGYLKAALRRMSAVELSFDPA